MSKINLPKLQALSESKSKVSEATGDQKFDKMIGSITKGKSTLSDDEVKDNLVDNADMKTRGMQVINNQQKSFDEISAWLKSEFPDTPLKYKSDEIFGWYQFGKYNSNEIFCKLANPLEDADLHLITKNLEHLKFYEKSKLDGYFNLGKKTENFNSLESAKKALKKLKTD